MRTSAFYDVCRLAGLRQRFACFSVRGLVVDRMGERGTAMFKKCAQRGLASGGLELYCYIGSCCFFREGCTGWRAVGVYGTANSQRPPPLFLSNR